MIFLEDKLRPHKDTPSTHLREWLVWMLLLALFLALLPVWWVDASLVSNLGNGDFSDFGDVIEHFSRRLLSFWLLPAMGFMLALRCGAIDLSVWATAGLGGVVSAVAIGAGLNPVVAIFAGISAGAVCGLINGTLVASLRLPCPIISALTAFGLILWLRGRYPSGEVVPDEGSLSGLLGGFQSAADWTGLPDVTLQGVAQTIVFIVYALTMLVILNGEMIERNRGRGFSERWRLFAALTASGALSAAGGVSWLIEHGRAPVPGRHLDDLVIPAAALLAGGLYLAGRGRTLLAAVLLPMSVAAVVAWRQEVMNLRCDFLAGYPLQVAVLMVMVAIARYAMTCAAVIGRWHSGALALALSSSAGIVVLAASVWTETPEIRGILHAVGGGVWLTGATGAIVLKLVSPRCEGNEFFEGT
ncbi:MAG: hypothetical protein ISS69_06035 [Phycisphaerae bacterium]|nr:hypothetical protein [Phycisphaerae bacterium]